MLMMRSPRSLPIRGLFSRLRVSGILCFTSCYRCFFFGVCSGCWIPSVPSPQPAMVFLFVRSLLLVLGPAPFFPVRSTTKKQPCLLEWNWHPPMSFTFSPGVFGFCFCCLVHVFLKISSWYMFLPPKVVFLVFFPAVNSDFTFFPPPPSFCFFPLYNRRLFWSIHFGNPFFPVHVFPLLFPTSTPKPPPFSIFFLFSLWVTPTPWKSASFCHFFPSFFAFRHHKHCHFFESSRSPFSGFNLLKNLIAPFFL